MLQLYAILIVGVAHAAANGFRLDPAQDFGMRGWPAAVIAWAPLLLIWTWQGLIVRWCERRIDRGGGGLRHISIADRVSTAAQWLLLLMYAVSVLAFGWGATVTRWLGDDAIFIDLIITIAPPIVGLAGVWAIHYPIVRRLRDAVLIRSLDEGRPLRRIPSRLRYVLLQARMNLLFMLVPLILIVTLSDIIDLYVPVNLRTGSNLWLNESLTLAAAFSVFLFAPVIARLALDLRSLPAGPVRNDLLKVCHDHKVRVRDILLWRTDGTMINGAVMGLIGWLRYVMLTDALLESMRREEVAAVMAHEIGHVRRHHMPWMLGALFSALLIPSLAFDLLLRAIEPMNGEGMYDGPMAWWMEGGVVSASLAAAFFIFGWVSRRFERQADTFAVQHLSGLREVRGKPDTGDVVNPDAAGAMQSALETVCRLNGINPRRRSWRHGSIRWRQRYLADIVGRPLRGLAIDRHVRWIKAATAVALVAGVTWAIVDTAMHGYPVDQSPYEWNNPHDDLGFWPDRSARADEDQR